MLVPHLQVNRLKTYAVTPEIKSKLNSLRGFKWASATWDGGNNDLRRQYNEWTLHRDFS